MTGAAWRWNYSAIGGSVLYRMALAFVAGDSHVEEKYANIYADGWLQGAFGGGD